MIPCQKGTQGQKAQGVEETKCFKIIHEGLSGFTNTKIPQHWAAYYAHISKGREYDAPEYHGSVTKAMLERGRFDAWVKGNALTRVVMPLNFERVDIACGTKMGKTTKRK